MHVVTVIMPYLLVGAVMPFFFFCCPPPRTLRFPLESICWLDRQQDYATNTKQISTKGNVMGGLKVRVIQGYPV